jgi:hypothetical protein
MLFNNITLQEPGDDYKRKNAGEEIVNLTLYFSYTYQPTIYIDHTLKIKGC